MDNPSQSIYKRAPHPNLPIIASAQNAFIGRPTLIATLVAVSILTIGLVMAASRPTVPTPAAYIEPALLTVPTNDVSVIVKAADSHVATRAVQWNGKYSWNGSTIWQSGLDASSVPVSSTHWVDDAP